MNRFILFLNLFLTTFIITAQTVIKGKVLDNDSVPISGASVILNKNNTIITYDITDNQGNYIININTKLDSLKIEVSYLGYIKQSKKIVNKTQTLNFSLIESSESLKEVFVKAKVIKKKGDTLSYRVSAFKNQKDRVIADVIKKMPGIDVLSDGKILYQGVPIQKYYIEGLDLLEGKYNLANNNLPASSVSKVQILENHQPIKLLDSLVFSNKISLNIKLKNKITTTGSAKIGSGFSPLLWDVNLTPMLFGKNKQIIGSYQTNNIGYDVKNELKPLTLSDWLEKLEGYEDNDWLRVNKLTHPLFSSKRWLNNNAHLVSYNSLMRIKKNTDFKIDLSYINDYQQQIGYDKTTYFTPSENFSINESTKNKFYSNSLKTKLIYNINANKKYLKNTLSFNKNWNSDKSEMLGLHENKQELTSNNYSFSNKLKYSFSVNKKIINIKSVVGYNNKPQNLRVHFNEEKNLNNQFDYNHFKQNIDFTNFYTNNYLGFTQGFNKFTLTANFGYKTFNKNLKSSLDLFDVDNQINLPSDYKNNLLFNKNEIYSKLDYNFVINNWKVTLKTPISYLNIKTKDRDLLKKQTLNKFLINPNLLLKKQINSYWKMVLNITNRNHFGNINQLYYGYLFSNYNSLQRYDNPILETKLITSRISLIYRNSIKALFYNFGYTYNHKNKNLISGVLIQNDGTSNFGFFPLDNKEKSHQLNFDISKYLSNIKTTFSVSSNYSQSFYNQLLNTELINAKTTNLVVSGKINSNLLDWLNIDFKNEYAINNYNFNSSTTEKYILDASFFLSKNQYLNFNVEYYKTHINNTENNYFLNLNYKYQFKKSKIDLELNWNNILNTKHYINTYNDIYTKSISTYNLRPSQLLLSAKFSLDRLFNK